MKKIILSTIFLIFASFSFVFSQEKQDSTILKTDSIQIKIDSLIKKEEVSFEKNSKKKKKKDEVVAVDSTLSYAEEYKRDRVKTTFGFRGGATLGKFIVDRSEVLQLQANGFPIIPFVKEEILTNTQSTIGYTGGLFFRLVRGSFYWQPEVDYTVRGGKIDILQKTGTVKRVEATFTSIDVPVVFGIRFRQGRIFLGPVATFQFKTSDNLLTTLRTYSPTPDEIKGNLFERPAFGIQTGLGFEFKKFFIEGRYEGGLSNYTKYDLGISSNPAKFNMRPQGFQFTIGFIR